MTQIEYPEGAVLRVEDMGPVERAYAEADHENCEDGPPHPLSHHSPWSGGDLEGTEPWPAFVDRLARHGLSLTPAGVLDEAALREAAQKAYQVLAGMDRQALNPGPDHLVKVTVEAWGDFIRPVITALAAALGRSGSGGGRG